MYEVIKQIFDYFKYKRVQIYDSVFLLHSKVTVAFLLASTLLISAKQYFGNPINCITDERNKEFLDTFCWVSGTYIYDYDPDHVGEEGINVGIKDYNSSNVRIYQRYYQWVIVILTLQAILFYAPAYLWKMWEGGRLQQLCDHWDSVLIPSNWEANRRNCLVSYFTKPNKNLHFCYAMKYFFCELLNFIVCVVNLLLMNTFFTGFWFEFSAAIKAIPAYNWDDWNYHSSRVFPKLAKCEFYKYGPSGSTQVYDSLCLLPLNILNEKLFAFFWVWFLLLAIISGIKIIWRMATLLIKQFRVKLLRVYALNTISYKLKKVTNDAHIGDWFLLYKIGSNINPIVFDDLLNQLYEHETKRLEKRLKDDHLFQI